MKKAIITLFVLLALLLSACTVTVEPAGNQNEPIKPVDEPKKEVVEEPAEEVADSIDEESLETEEGEEDTIETPEVPDVEETEEPVKEMVYSMGENVAVDYLSYKVMKVESFTEMGTSFLRKDTQGKFIKVYIEIMNNAKETKEMFTPRFKIVDSQGRKFDRLSTDSMYISDGLEFGVQLQPGLGSSGAIVFELPKDASDLVLEILGDWISVSQVSISLSSISDIGEDTTLKDEQDEIMDEAMEESKEMMEDLMNQCNTPFKCSGSCPDMMDVGQKDCPEGQVCCMQ